MTSCPSESQILGLLDEELDPADEDRIVLHVENCSRCQERLDALVSGRLPNPPWRPSLPAEIAVCPGPAPTSSPLEDRLRDCDCADSPPAVASDPTVALAPIAEAPTVGDPTPTELDQPGRAQGPTDVDVPEPPDRPMSGGARARPIPDSQVTTDVIPPMSIGSSRADAIDVGIGAATDVERSVNGDRTIPQSRPAAPGPRARRDRSRGDQPEIPGYEVLGKLGEGGMGVVYKARQLGLNRLVALKMIRGGGQARVDHLARFRVEAEAVARLRHPNILQIYDIGEADGLPFVSLELLDGGDLDNRLAGTPQPGRPGSELVATLARAVHAAHQAGIIHRDLKPSNILFTADGLPKVTDFGLAKRLESDSRQTETGQIMGTPSYMAPEQARGHTRDIGPAADTYAIGAILYQVLTGRPPFMGETPMETVRQVIDDDPVPPSRLVPRVPRDLETICLKCLQKEPKKRYESAQDLADDLDRYRSGNTIRARRTSIGERGIKWSRRRPVLAMWAGLGLLAALGLIGWRINADRLDRLATQRSNERLVAWESQGIALSEQADRARTRDDLEKVLRELGTFHPDVEADPRLGPIRALVDRRKQRVADQLGDLNTLEAARERFQKFLDLRQEAQWYAVGFTGLGPADRSKKLRDAAGAALQFYAEDPAATVDAWALMQPMPGALSEAERVRVREGCYDLLLLLSQADVAPADGLQVLDRATRLRPEPTAAFHIRRAECLGRAGDRAGRDREIRAAGLRRPSTPLDCFLNGRELVFRREFAEAIPSLDRALQLDADQASAHLLLAVCDLSVQPKRSREAIGSLTVCIRANPGVAGLYLLRASAFGEEGHQSLSRIVAGRTSDPEAARSRREASDAFEAAEADFGRALDRKPGDDLGYALFTQRALLRLAADRLDEATADLDAAIRLDPGAYQAYTTMAQVRLRQVRLDEADAAFGRAIACHPGPGVLAGLHRSRALIHASRDDLTPARRAAALRDLEQAIAQEPDRAIRAGDHVWRARLYLRAGQCPEALADCDAALSLAPDDPEAHRVRVGALMELKRYDAVLAAADAYLARGRPIAEILELRGLAHQARRDYTAAIADFGRALDLTPGSEASRRSRLLNRRGWGYQYADAPRLARSDFEESLRLEPNQSDAHGGRGLAQVRLGEWRPAVLDAEAAVRHTEMASAGEDAGAARVQALFNAARIYAQAVEFAARDVSREGERAVALYRRYRTRALDLLDETLKQVPDRGRREEILRDPALRPLRLAPTRSPGLPPRAGRGYPDAALAPAEGFPGAWPGSPDRRSL